MLHPSDRSVCWAILSALLFPALAQATPGFVHGLWVWKSPSVYQAPGGPEQLRDFCKAQTINEVYLSVSTLGETSEESRLAALITLLQRSDIRVEALLSSTDADEPGKHREALLNHVRDVLRFNQGHPTAPFDGIHLDVEPQQRPENKGAGNLAFLPGLADTLRAVWGLAEPVGMTVNADIQSKVLKGDLASRRMLLSAVPRVTLMMYELSSPKDVDTSVRKAENLEQSSQKFLEMAYAGATDRTLAKMVIALRTSDYGELLSEMLKRLDAANGRNPHYLGWARHAYGSSVGRPPGK